MRWLLPLAALLTLAVTAAGGSVAPGPAQPLVDASGPSTSDCTESTSNRFLMPFDDQCIVIDSGDTVRWTNVDITAHDPGDGVAGDDFSTCFQARHDGGVLRFGDEYSAEVHFNGTHVILRDVTARDGSVVDQERVCSNDPLLKVWHRNADGDVVVPWICHIHEDRPERFIVIDV